MITGVVNQQLEAVVSLEIRGPHGNSRTIDVVVDTGYNGFLIMPPVLAAEFGLPLVGTAEATLADGSVITHGVYRARAIWDGQERLLRVDEAETTPLIGMRLLEGSDLHVQVRSGGRVTIA